MQELVAQLSRPVALSDRAARELSHICTARNGVLDLTNHLEEGERAVIRSYDGLGQAQRTLLEIGAGHGLTAERARQIEAVALAKLRQALARPATIGSSEA